MKYKYLIFDATNQLARARHASARSSVLSPIEEHILKKLRKKNSLTPDEESQRNELIEVQQKAVIDNAFNIFLNILFTNIRKFQPEQIILAWDYGSWRYDFYPEYKWKRKKDREAQSEEDKAIQHRYHVMMDAITEQMYNTNLHNIRVKKCEADDIVGILANVLDDHCMIVTSDSDYHQLLMNPTNHIFDPIKKKQIKLTPTEARYSLLFKIIRGDTSDSILSSFPRIRETKIREMFEDPLLHATMLQENAEFNAKYEFNKTLIAFERIPDSIKLDILREYKKELTTDKKSFSMQNWIEFSKATGLKGATSELTKINSLLY